MASSVVKDSSEPNNKPLIANMKVAQEEEEEEEEEEEMFEINLEAVDSIPPSHYWDNYFTAATSSALLANCLLPIAEVSGAIPMVAKDSCTHVWSAEKRRANSWFILAESLTNFPGKFVGIPCLGLQHKKMHETITELKLN